MLAEILQTVDSCGAVSVADLERRTGAGRAAVLRAVADLAREGWLEFLPPQDPPCGGSSLCGGCRALPGCRAAVWRLTGKARRYLG